MKMKFVLCITMEAEAYEHMPSADMVRSTMEDLAWDYYNPALDGLAQVIDVNLIGLLPVDEEDKCPTK